MSGLLQIGLALMISSLPCFIFIVYDSRRVNQLLKYDFEECKTFTQGLLYVLTWIIVGLFSSGAGIVIVYTIFKILEFFMG